MRFRILLLVAVFGYLSSPTLAAWAAPWRGLTATLMLSVGIYGAWCAVAVRRRIWQGAHWEQGADAEEFGEAALTALFGVASAGQIWGVETTNWLIVGLFFVSAIFAGDAVVAWLRGRSIPERVGYAVMSAVAAALGLLSFFISPFLAAPTTVERRKGGFETVEQACLAQGYYFSRVKDGALGEPAHLCEIAKLEALWALRESEHVHLGEVICSHRSGTKVEFPCEVKQCADGFVPPLEEGWAAQQDC